MRPASGDCDGRSISLNAYRKVPNDFEIQPKMVVTVVVLVVLVALVQLCDFAEDHGKKPDLPGHYLLYCTGQLGLTCDDCDISVISTPAVITVTLSAIFFRPINVHPIFSKI
ncbi:hypothetical protein QAD02_013050 [Eretmocerus hayati]|uniref:Uncharacterized protein n=1 Tax=Eretmocerus hayati TaxID=131215 RepID=A0ACC2P2E7_9HYME|nr:hypothetical protein QAD02_013050 [Eretmocerus hayati]